MIDRYCLKEMKKIWSKQGKYKRWLMVELAVIEARAVLGEIPSVVFDVIRKKANFDIMEIEKLEETLHHDLIAFVQNVQSYLEKYAGYFHYGLTSYDIEDPALSLLIEDASSLIIKDIKSVIDILKVRVKEFKDTIMVGRTHGVHAEPITFGFKLCVWMDEMRRNLKRIKSVKEELRVGKISGACGTYQILSPEVERIALERLGLRVAPISTQILQRDRHANYLSVLAVIASSLENFTVQIRLMQQTERGEVREPFSRGQRGSSAMPHKQNPIISERISGLARVVRSNALSSMQNMALWDERDISHSSVERIIIPDSTILLDYILNKFRYMIENLEVDKKRMYENLEMSKGLVFSQTVRLALIEKGMSPDDAYNIIQRAAFRSKEEDRKFKEILLDEKEIRNYLSAEELDTCFDTEKVLKNISYILDRFGI